MPKVYTHCGLIEQIQNTLKMLIDYSECSESDKKAMAREILESLIVLQHYVSEEIISTYKVFDESYMKIIEHVSEEQLNTISKE